MSYERITKFGFVCGFSEREMAVNAPNSPEALRHRARLHLTVTTPRDSELLPVSQLDDQAMIQLKIRIGEGANNMFTPCDKGGYGTITCPGFIVKGWEASKKSQNIIICKLIQNESDSHVFRNVQTLSLLWTDICSTAPEGVCTVNIELSGFPGMERREYECRLFKVAAPLQINYFEAQPGSGSVGQKILLKWQVENAGEGYILPGGYNIFEEGVQSTSTREIVLDEAFDRYYLHIANEEYGAYRTLNVFAVAPYIEAFMIKNRKASWEVHFADTVELSCCGNPYIAVDSAGEYPLDDKARLVSLRCSGSGQIMQRHICVPAHKEILKFEMDKQMFKNHKILTVRWETEGASDIKVQVWDTHNYIMSTCPKGTWEQAYENKTVTVALYYTTSGGVRGKEELSDG